MVNMPLEFMHTVTVRERSDLSGTLVFEDFWKRCGEDGDEKCPYEFRDIEDVRHIQELISAARDDLLRSRRAERLESAS